MSASSNLDPFAERKTWWSRSLRWPLDRLPKEMAMPILSGPLLARRWIVGAGLHGCWLGTYQRRKQQAIKAHLESGMVACDIGADAGLYSLLMAKAVGKSGLVYAFEPHPAQLKYLRRHLHLNGVRNVVSSGEAVADFVGEARLAAARDGSVGRLDHSGQFQVPIVTLDHLFSTGRLQPADLVRIDVEGAELKVLQGGRNFLKRFRPVVFLATHGREIHGRCCEFLQACGYRLRTLDDDSDLSQAEEIIATTR